MREVFVADHDPIALEPTRLALEPTRAWEPAVAHHDPVALEPTRLALEPTRAWEPAVADHGPIARERADAFRVRNSGVDDVTAILLAAVRAIGDILADVEATLATMPASAQTSALAPWGDLKRTWTAAYNDMVVRIQGNSSAVHCAHDAYTWGDRQSTMIMM